MSSLATPPVLKNYVLGLTANQKKTHCFKNLDLTLLPCDYSNQKNLWIDGPAFRKWLLKMNQSLITKNRRILLTMDNCIPHDITNLSLSNIAVEYYCPISSCKHHKSLDQGIILILKRNYWKQLVQAVTEAIDSGRKIRKWNVLDAIRAVSSAWKSISENHIKNCFTKAWGDSNESDSNLDVVITEYEDWDYVISINPQMDMVRKISFTCKKSFFAN